MVNYLDHEFFARQEQKPLEELLALRFEAMQTLGEIKITNGTVTLLNRAKSLSTFSYLQYFADMSLYLFDTYLLVLMAVQEVANNGYTLKQD